MNPLKFIHPALDASVPKTNFLAKNVFDYIGSAPIGLELTSCVFSSHLLSTSGQRAYLSPLFIFLRMAHEKRSLKLSHCMRLSENQLAWLAFRSENIRTWDYSLQLQGLLQKGLGQWMRRKILDFIGTRKIFIYRKLVTYMPAINNVRLSLSPRRVRGMPLSTTPIL